MELSQQVVSLELSKKLKELGVKQESLFYWRQYIFSDTASEKEKVCLQINNEAGVWGVGNIKDNDHKESVSAFTVAELGDLLLKRREYQVRNDGKYYYYVLKNGSIETTIGDENESDARAKMLVYLLENKVIKL